RLKKGLRSGRPPLASLYPRPAKPSDLVNRIGPELFKKADRTAPFRRRDLQPYYPYLGNPIGLSSIPYPLYPFSYPPIYQAPKGAGYQYNRFLGRYEPPRLRQEDRRIRFTAPIGI